MKVARWTVAAALLVAGCGFAQTAPANGAASAEQATAVKPDADATIPAGEQATREQLKKLFEVMRMRQQFEAMMKMLPSMVQQQVHAQMEELTAKLPGANQLTPEQQAALDKLTDKYMQKAQAIYPADEMIEDAITVYQRHMTKTDVDAYIVFYSSAPGRHFLDAQPQIMKEYMPLVMQRAQERSKQLYAEMAADLADFIKTAAPAK